MSAARKRAEAMAQAAAKVIEGPFSGPTLNQAEILAEVLDAYFAHTRFLEDAIGPGNFVRFKPEPTDE